MAWPDIKIFSVKHLFAAPFSYFPTESSVSLVYSDSSSTRISRCAA
jgi:hypothetical protein